jgi:NCS2 family nucleobase:cation symporter-2
MAVAAAWSAGGFGNPDFGNPLYLGIAATVLVSILLLVRYTRGFLNNIAILLGLAIGFLISGAAGQVSLGELNEAPWFRFHSAVPLWRAKVQLLAHCSDVHRDAGDVY